MDFVAELRRGVGNCGPQDIREAEELMDKAADEIERLRTALESLSKDPPADSDEPDPNWRVIKKMRTIARAALEQSARQEDK